MGRRRKFEGYNKAKTWGKLRKSRDLPEGDPVTAVSPCMNPVNAGVKYALDSLRVVGVWAFRPGAGERLMEHYAQRLGQRLYGDVLFFGRAA